MSRLRNLNRAYARGRVLGTPHTGVIGSLISSIGENGPGFAYNDLDLPADANKEICGRITTWPLFGDLEADEYTGFKYTRTSPGDGADSFQYQLQVDGVSVGSPTGVTLGIGNGTGTTAINCNTGAATADGLLANISSIGIATIEATVGAATGQGAGAYIAQGITISGDVAEGLAGAATAAIIVIPTEGPMSFTPSTARTVTINPGAKPFAAGELWNMSDSKKPRSWKDSDSTVDYSFNWTPWLLDVTDTIVSHEILVTEGLQKEGSTVNGAIVTVFVSAGNLSKRASITCRITTGSTPPRIEDRTIYLDIESA
jgi:hypothetical protein